jgi:predicted nucleic acid-binding protein
VLSREELAEYFTAADRRDILEFLHGNAEVAIPAVVIVDLPDPDDSPFLEVALAAAVPLVTGNKRHFPVDRRRGCPVLTPVEFLNRFATG